MNLLNPGYKDIIDSIKLFYETYNRLPLEYDLDNTVIKLRLFLNCQKVKYTIGILNELEYKLLCEIPTFEDELLCFDFAMKVSNIIEYYENNGILPKPYNKDINIKKMGEFLDEQKNEIKNKTLCDDKIEVLCKIPAFYKYLYYNNNQYMKNLSIHEKYLYIKNYYDDYKKLPTLKDDNPLLKSLCKFITNLIYVHKNDLYNIDKYKIFCQILAIERRIKKTPNEYFEDMTNKLIEFCKINGDIPYGYKTENNEKKLNLFLRYQKRLYTLDKLSDEKYNMLSKSDIVLNYLHK